MTQKLITIGTVLPSTFNKFTSKPTSKMSPLSICSTFTFISAPVKCQAPKDGYAVVVVFV